MQTPDLTAGHPPYSNRSSIIYVLTDTVNRRYFLLTRCSADTSRLKYAHTNRHRGCFGNLSGALEPCGIAYDAIPVCFNIFMHVAVHGDTGMLAALPPKSRAGEHLVKEGKMDLVTGETACSAEMSNNYSLNE